jgi:anthranilate phosphoribosyltransferase
MLAEIQSPLREALAGRPVSADDMAAAVGALMDGRASEIEIAALLTALAAKGETAEEIAGAAAAMRSRAARVGCSTPALLDTCGTGGDGSRTFNISTAAALVVAAAGAPVAKHGNRSATSTSGSAEVLQSLGVNIELQPEQVACCVDEVGIGFCYARLLHNAMRHVAPVRAALGFRTIFNLLGPLTNPASAEYQIIGTTSNATAEKLARAILQLGTRRTLVVCGNDQLDEVSLWGTTCVFDVQADRLSRLEWTAADFGLAECRLEELRINSPAESAEVIRGILAGKPGPARDIVVANAAAALWCIGRAETTRAAAALAAEQIDSGAAHKKLEQLAAWTTRAAQTH